ncbi:hypothetical protein HT118_09895 [Escherichia coli]|nr:hypothetical protein [Escherichia coli]
MPTITPWCYWMPTATPVFMTPVLLGGAEIIRFRHNDAKEGANKRGNSSRLTQSFHFFMFEPIFFSRKCLESAYLDRFFAI